MKYQVKSKDEIVNKIRNERESRWDSIVERGMIGETIKRDEAINILYDFQEYFNSDFPFSKVNCDRSVVLAIDLICRSAIELLINNDVESKYVLSNFCGAINHLKLSDF